MSYKFVESVVLSPRDVKLDGTFMRELLNRWERPVRDPASPAASAASPPSAVSPTTADHPETRR